MSSSSSSPPFVYAATSRSTLADFKILQRLGSGSFGVVYKVLRYADNGVYVLKQVNIDGLSEREQRSAYNEVKILYEIMSPFVVTYYDSFIDGGTLNLVMEYCDLGDLQQALKRQATTGKPVPERTIWGIFIQVLLGLYDLHSLRILHRDLKTANIFLSSKNRQVKLGDLGVARILGTETHFAKTCVGTPYYLSPELCEDKPYNEKSDMWALGCILYECCTLKHPFDANNQGALVLKILQGHYPPVPSFYSQDLRSIVDRLLTRDSERRPNTSDVLTDKPVFERASDLGIQLPSEVTQLYYEIQRSQTIKTRERRQQKIAVAKQQAAIDRLAKPRRNEPKRKPTSDDIKSPSKEERSTSRCSTPSRTPVPSHTIELSLEESPQRKRSSEDTRLTPDKSPGYGPYSRDSKNVKTPPRVQRGNSTNSLSKPTTAAASSQSVVEASDEATLELRPQTAAVRFVHTPDRSSTNNRKVSTPKARQWYQLPGNEGEEIPNMYENSNRTRAEKGLATASSGERFPVYSSGKGNRAGNKSESNSSRTREEYNSASIQRMSKQVENAVRRITLKDLQKAGQSVGHDAEKQKKAPEDSVSGARDISHDTTVMTLSRSIPESSSEGVSDEVKREASEDDYSSFEEGDDCSSNSESWILERDGFGEGYTMASENQLNQSAHSRDTTSTRGDDDFDYTHPTLQSTSKTPSSKNKVHLENSFEAFDFKYAGDIHNEDKDEEEKSIDAMEVTEKLEFADLPELTNNSIQSIAATIADINEDVAFDDYLFGSLVAGQRNVDLNDTDKEELADCLKERIAILLKVKEQRVYCIDVATHNEAMQELLETILPGNLNSESGDCSSTKLSTPARIQVNQAELQSQLPHLDWSSQIAFFRLHFFEGRLEDNGKVINEILSRAS